MTIEEIHKALSTASFIADQLYNNRAMVNIGSNLPDIVYVRNLLRRLLTIQPALKDL